VTSALLKDSHKDGFERLAQSHPWVHSTPLVVKPDQLIKRRGKAGLLAVNKTWEEVQQWITERMDKEQQVEQVSGLLDTFIVEPFVPHSQEDEYYVCITSTREGEQFLFHHEGGVDVGDVDAKAVRLDVAIDCNSVTVESIEESLLKNVPQERRAVLASFLLALFHLYRDLNFVYMEINPVVVVGSMVTPLDMAAKIDETAAFLCASKWGEIDFPAPFGRPEFPEEAAIKRLDSGTGASLKLTILNHSGRVWTMVAGGGASVVYADTISDYGFGHELANYGEYSGAPSESQTYEYAQTILGLMTRVKDPRGKVLIIGGGIANFTDVAATFTGIITALKQYAEELRDGNISIWVRRGGPNFQEGLRKMKATGESINVPIHVFGPETHITAIVPMALGIVDASGADEYTESVCPSPRTVDKNVVSASRFDPPAPLGTPQAKEAAIKAKAFAEDVSATNGEHTVQNFDRGTRSIVYGLQQRAVQGMLDFDFMCKRDQPSVACMVFPFSGNHYVKFYWGTDEILIPVYTSIAEAVKRHPDTSCLINFASFRSVYETTIDALNFPEIRTIALIAEGVPESQTRKIIKVADEKHVGIIGPATVGGIKPGCMRIGNTGGMLDNIVMSKLYRPGSVAYVSKSGGMSNELNNIIARNSDGVYEGVAIGGDRYPGTRFIDHMLRYEDNPDVHMLVLLGEVGGVDEYDICDAIKSGRITKPLVAWCIGTCASIFPFEVQFGHAGACARGQGETAADKNSALAAAGAIVPTSFDNFPAKIAETYRKLVKSGSITPVPEPPEPKVPMDYTWARKLGLVRKPANFISSISDDRGQELSYAGMPISEVFTENVGVGGVLGLLWFRRRLPDYATKFIEMILMVTADHGPAVSGAHNTIVASRAGKDLVSSLCSGLLTIGPRFGGALDSAAEMFAGGSDSGIDADEFVKSMRRKNQLIMGIGHKVKSLSNPDMRVVIVREFAQKHFKSNKVLDFALSVEAVTTRKKETLILNVDGCIAACFVDMLRSCGAFTQEEADELITNGCLNGLFVLGRSVGFIGHFLDQKRLKQPLYRHPTDDISYVQAGGM
jgi:ATP citrate (pro-S)-lyase